MTAVVVLLLGFFIGAYVMKDGNEKLYDYKKASEASALMCDDPSLTVQADMEDADINTIVRRFHITGEMPVSVRLPEYQDYEDVFDFQSAQNAILEAERTFMSIPADVRAKFDNDPQLFLEFAQNPENYDGLVELGLAKERIKEDYVPPVVVKSE